MNILKRIKTYLILCRIQTTAVSALTPVFGALAMGETQFSHLTLLFIYGIFAHIRGFVTNEYCDSEFDRASPYTSSKPLAQGSISKSAALLIIFISLFLSWLMVVVLFFNPVIVLIAFVHQTLDTIYNLKGKKIIGLDTSLAASVFFLCLFGAFTVNTTLNPIVFYIATLGALQVLFNNAIEGGLKDIESDYQFGAQTVAIALGVRTQGENLKIPLRFKLTAFIIKLAPLFFIYLILSSPMWELSHMKKFPILALITILVTGMLFTLFRFLSLKKFQRENMKKIFSLHEIFTYSIVPLLFYPTVGIMGIFILIFLPLLWYVSFNVLLYSKPFQPAV